MQHHPLYKPGVPHERKEDGVHFAEKFNTFLEVLEHRASLHPDDIAFTFLKDGDVNRTEDMTFGEVEMRAKAIGAFMQGNHPEKTKGNKALLVFPFENFDFNVAFYACLASGVTAVPTYPPDPTRLERSLPRFVSILTDCMPRYGLTNSFLFNHFKPVMESFPELKQIKWICVDDVPDESAADWVDVGVEHDTTALIQYTSGSTGLPKGAVISHGNLLYNVEAMAVNFSSTNRSHVMATWLPLFHDMGLIGNMLYPHFLGIRSIVMSPLSFLKNPLCYPKAMAHFGAQFGCMPNFGYDLLVRRSGAATEEALKGMDMGPWRIAFCGAEPVRAATVRRFCEKFAPYGFAQKTFYPCYGLAECTLFVAGESDMNCGPSFLPVKAASLQKQYSKVEVCKEGDEGSITLVSSGVNQTGSKLCIVHPVTEKEQPNLTVGEIWVSGPTVAQGYYNKPELTERLFKAYLKKPDDSVDDTCGPFCRTGDLGFFDNVHLYVCGRLKDLIIIRGKNLYPNDIEGTVEEAHELVRKGCSVAFSVEDEDQEVLVVVAEIYPKFTKAQAEELVKKIREDVSRENEVAIQALMLIGPGVLHKTSSGKVQRSLEKEVFEEGETEALVAWTQADGLMITDRGQDILTGKEIKKRKIGDVDFSQLQVAAEREAEREARRSEKDAAREAKRLKK